MSETTSRLQINLMPDVRLAKQRAQTQRRTVGSITTTICVAAAVLVVIAYAATLAQSRHIANQTTQISSLSSQLFANKDLNDVVTLQQHLAAVTPLYAQRAYLTKFFAIMQNVATSDVSINSLDFQSPAGDLTISGHAKSFAAADKYVKILQGGISDAKTSNGTPYFSNLSINGLNKDGTTTNFSIKVTVNPEAIHG